jgi:GNAT superfamily N-acetyltransferase
MQDVLIRQVTASDLDACYFIEHQCFLPAEAATKETIHRRIKLFPEGFLIAARDGQTIGFLNSGGTDQDDLSDQTLKSMANHTPNADNLVVFAIAVLPDHQRQGIAGLLLERIIEYARQTRKKKVMLICKNYLIAYYKKRGFRYEGPSQATHGGFEWHEMHLNLDSVPAHDGPV